jgi:predicted ATPase
MDSQMARERAVGAPFIRAVSLKPDTVPGWDDYPYAISAIRALTGLEFAAVTIFVGENGAGKSTLLEAIAVATGFNPEGGSRNFAFVTHESHSALWEALRISRSPRRPRTGFFLRAESYFNVATEIERLDAIPGAGPLIAPAFGGLPHRRSHGESFLALVGERFSAGGLYLLDEPESALSPISCMRLLRRIGYLVDAGCQFIVATHSPILMAFPGARLYRFSDTGIRQEAFEDLEEVQVTRDFLNSPGQFVRRLMTDDTVA